MAAVGLTSSLLKLQPQLLVSAWLLSLNNIPEHGGHEPAGNPLLCYRKDRSPTYGRACSRILCCKCLASSFSAWLHMNSMLSFFDGGHCLRL